MIGPMGPDLVRALGWALLHSLWQGAAVALALWVSLLATRRSGPNVRYLLSCLALATALMLFLATAGYAMRPAPPPTTISLRPVHPAESAPPTGEDLSPAPVALDRPVAAIVDAFPWIVRTWLAGVALFLVRLLIGWIGAERLRYRLVSQVPEPVRRLMEETARRMRVWRPVWILESGAVEVPTLVGWLRPLVLLPASTVRRLSESQLAAILAHELAHVRRHDYLVNLIQSVVETVLFHHPCIWWISRRIREEREHCCDDLALAVAEPVAYSRALLLVEELRRETTPASSLALAATGGSLLSRVTRLVLPSVPRIPRPALSTALIVCVLALGATSRSRASSDPSPFGREFLGQLNQPITIHRDDATMAEAIAELTSLTGLRFTIPPNARQDRVSLHFDATEADIVYQCLFNLKEMDWREDEASRSVVASWWPGSGPVGGAPATITLETFHARQRLFRDLAHEVGWFEVRHATVGEGLRQLHAVYGLNVKLSDPAIADLSADVFVRDSSVRGALHALLRPHALVYRYSDEGAVEVYAP